MKYIIGFFTGVLMTAMFFLWWTKKNLTAVNSPVATEQTIKTSNSRTNDFDTFYERFHTDSIFQLSHIIFPLQGIPPRDSLYVPGMEDNFKWEKENWVLHRKFDDMDGTFNREFIEVGEDLMIENIKLTNGNYGMQRRYSRSENGWNLIYYAGMNELAVESN